MEAAGASAMEAPDKEDDNRGVAMASEAGRRRVADEHEAAAEAEDAAEAAAVTAATATALQAEEATLLAEAAAKREEDARYVEIEQQRFEAEAKAAPEVAGETCFAAEAVETDRQDDEDESSRDAHATFAALEARRRQYSLDAKQETIRLAEEVFNQRKAALLQGGMSHHSDKVWAPGAITAAALPTNRDAETKAIAEVNAQIEDRVRAEIAAAVLEAEKLTRMKVAELLRSMKPPWLWKQNVKQFPTGIWRVCLKSTMQNMRRQQTTRAKQSC